MEKVQRVITEHELVSPGARIAVGVSGGADSVSLLYALHFLQKKFEFTLVVGHVNHQLRGSAAEEDARFIQQLAWRLGVPFYSTKVDAHALAKKEGVSIEMAARQARHKFFKSLIRADAADVAALAHTAGDQAETVLLKLARGTGIQGLGGMPYDTTIEGLRIVRPLLDVSHEEAINFLVTHKLKWREDASNRELHFLRNRVRHEVMPLLENRLNPQVRQALIRMADLMRAENDWINEYAQGLLTRCAADKGGKVLNVQTLNRYPLAMRRRIILNWLISAGVVAARIDFDVVRRVERLARSIQGTRRLSLGEGKDVMLRYKELSIEPAVDSSQVASPFRMALGVPGESILLEPGLRIQTQWSSEIIRDKEGSIGMLPAHACLSRKAIGESTLYVRSWRPGDRIKPLGMKGTKKIQDLLVDEKVPRDRRGTLPLIECRREIVWVPGYQVANGWEVHKGEQALHLLVERC